MDEVVCMGEHGATIFSMDTPTIFSMDEVVCMGETRLEPPSSLWMKWFVWGEHA